MPQLHITCSISCPVWNSSHLPVYHNLRRDETGLKPPAACSLLIRETARRASLLLTQTVSFILFVADCIHLIDNAVVVTHIPEAVCLQTRPIIITRDSLPGILSVESNKTGVIEIGPRKSRP